MPVLCGLNAPIADIRNKPMSGLKPVGQYRIDAALTFPPLRFLL